LQKGRVGLGTVASGFGFVVACGGGETSANGEESLGLSMSKNWGDSGGKLLEEVKWYSPECVPNNARLFKLPTLPLLQHKSTHVHTDVLFGFDFECNPWTDHGIQYPGAT